MDAGGFDSAWSLELEGDGGFVRLQVLPVETDASGIALCDFECRTIGAMVSVRQVEVFVSELVSLALQVRGICGHMSAEFRLESVSYQGCASAPEPHASPTSAFVVTGQVERLGRVTTRADVITGTGARVQVIVPTDQAQLTRMSAALDALVKNRGWV